MKDQRIAVAHMRDACRKCLRYAEVGEETFHTQDIGRTR
jgi:hypothetical protein